MSLTTLCLLPAPKKVRPIVNAARVGLHHKSHKIHSTLEGVVCLIMAWQTQLPLLAVLSVAWACLDFYCLFDSKEVENETITS